MSAAMSISSRGGCPTALTIRAIAAARRSAIQSSSVLLPVGGINATVPAVVGRLRGILKTTASTAHEDGAEQHCPDEQIGHFRAPDEINPPAAPDTRFILVVILG